MDGIDIRRATLASVRANIAYMPQRPFLLPLTIAENIAYGHPSAACSDVLAAGAAAKVDEFVESLPKGYDTVIGERGVTLSAGQSQRISLARALLKDARSSFWTSLRPRSIQRRNRAFSRMCGVCLKVVPRL